MNKPERSFRAGSVCVSVWNNEKTDPKGKTKEFKTVTFERSYKDKDDEWQKTNSFGINDIPKAITALGRAYEYLTLKEDVREELVV